MARSLLFQSHLPKIFWSFAIKHSVYLINRLPTPLLLQKSPYEVLYKSKPDFFTLHAFGYLAYANSLKAGRTKFDLRASKCIFLGEKLGTKGFLLFNLKTHDLFLSRDVYFYDTIFPFQDTNPPLSEQAHVTSSLDNDIGPFFDPLDNIQPLELSFSFLQNSDPTTNSPTSIPINTGSFIEQNVLENIEVEDSLPTTRVSTRIKQKNKRLEGYFCGLNASIPADINHSSNDSSIDCLYPMHDYLSFSRCSRSHHNFGASISLHHEPSSFCEANKHTCWQQAMGAELQALDRNRTWSLMKLPHGKHVIGCKWVYRIKYHADGSVDRYKARLVAKGYTQTKGVDYFDIFSLVAKLTTLWFLLAVASSKNWYLHQLDVDNAFLHGDLVEKVYMRPPPGLSCPSGTVCRLHKSLYGLKQASRQWNLKLTEALSSIGYSQSSSNYSLFVRQTSSSFTALLVYVDDIVLTGTTLSEISRVKAFLHQSFGIKDLGALKYFLGLELPRSKAGLVVNQRKYCMELISEVGLTGCKPASSPIDPAQKLSSEIGELIPDPSLYRRLVGHLQYLTTTHLDICFAVQQLS